MPDTHCIVHEADGCCALCGGIVKEHGIYGTMFHVPDLDKINDGYSVSTARCPGFLTHDRKIKENQIWEENGLKGSFSHIISMVHQAFALSRSKK